MSLRVGLIGCGNISESISTTRRCFRDIAFVACADIDPDGARNGRRSDTQSPRARVGELLASDDVDIVLNLTIPEAHAEVSLAALEAGKHVYSEKPLATTVADGRAIVAAARAKGCASAPRRTRCSAPASSGRAR